MEQRQEGTYVRITRRIQRPTSRYEASKGYRSFHRRAAGLSEFQVRTYINLSEWIWGSSRLE